MPETIPTYSGYSNEEFRTAPWFILREKDIKSKGAALILSVLWSATQGTRITKITNSEIAKRAGFKTNPEAIRYHLSNLESLGLIKREGAHKNRKIRILFTTQENPLFGLTIPPNILALNIAPIKKLILSIKESFPNMGTNSICQRLGITKNRYYQSNQPPEKTKFNPLKKRSEPPEKTNSLGIEGREEVEMVSSDTIERAPHVSIDKGGLKMTYPEYAPLTSSPSRKLPPPSLEIEKKWKSFPNNANHRLGSKAYEEARSVIHQLQVSPRKGLSVGEIEKLTKSMMNPPERFQKKYTKDEINAFLDHKFTPPERLKIYEMLSQHHDRAFNRKAKGKANLATALCNIEGYSLIMRLWYDPPKPQRCPVIAIGPELDGVVDMVMEALGDESRYTLSQVKKNIKSLSLYYRKILRPKMSEETRQHYGDFRSYIRGYINWAVDQQRSNYKITHYWFRADSRPFQQWEKVVREWTNVPMETSDYLAECMAEL